MNKKIASELLKLAKILVADLKEGDTCIVNIGIVKKHDSMPPYIKLVQKEIKSGEGKVDVKYVKNGMAGIYGSGTHNWIMGCPEVPVESLRKV